MESITSKVIVYGYFNHTKIDKKGEEKGSICINYLIPKKSDRATDIGYNTGFSWVSFDEELWKVLESCLLKPTTLTFSLVEDYSDSTRLIKVLSKINDYVIKQ